MATQRWIAGNGVGLSETSCFGTELNSLVNGNAVLSSDQIDNTSALDTFADISTNLGSVTTGSGAPFIGLYLYVLNEDGSTYGDGNFTSSATGPPPSAYFVGAIPCQVSAAGAIVGTARGILLPPKKLKFVLYNEAGVTLASSGNTVDYVTYNLQVS